MRPANPICGNSADAQPNGSQPATLKNGSSLPEKNRDGREGGDKYSLTFFLLRKLRSTLFAGGLLADNRPVHKNPRWNIK